MISAQEKHNIVAADIEQIVISFNGIVFHKSWINCKSTITYPSSSGLEVLLDNPKKKLQS